MNPLRRRALAVLIAMLVTVLATWLAHPTIRMAEAGTRVDLEAMVPRHFGNWAMDERESAVVVNPQGEGLVSQIYQQVLARTYVDVASGRIVMLSIAYGENQTHSHDLHVPDICYPAGGFQIERSARGELATRFGNVPVKRLVTQRLQRREPLTYWAVIGERVATSAVGAKLTALTYGLRGIVPDGLIFRVSTVGLPDDESFATQQEFVQSLLDAMSGASRKRLAGLS
ncbi:MAG TPA: EpsI family protein [Rhodocyclaceae bacterium]